MPILRILQGENTYAIFVRKKYIKPERNKGVIDKSNGNTGSNIWNWY